MHFLKLFSNNSRLVFLSILGLPLIANTFILCCLPLFF